MAVESHLYNAPFDRILEGIEERLVKAHKEAVTEGLGVEPWIREALELTQRASYIYDEELVRFEVKKQQRVSSLRDHEEKEKQHA
jgi:hypothetical protein